MQSGDNAGTSPVSEWPTGTWSTQDVPSSYSAPLVSARVPSGRSTGQRDDASQQDESSKTWPGVAANEQTDDDVPSETRGLERRTAPTGLGGSELGGNELGASGTGGDNFGGASGGKLDESGVQFEQRERGIALIAAGLSHDLNNLLVGVLGNAELAQAACVRGDDPSSHLLAIRVAAERASALASSMVRFASEQRSSDESFDLSDLVGEIVMLARAGVSKSAQVVGRTGLAVQEPWNGAGETLPSPPNVDDTRASLLVRGDSGQVGQVLMNLIVNGADALGSEGGEVSIDVDRAFELPESMVLRPTQQSAEGFARLRVSDTGRGIPADCLPRIFEPFFSTKRQGRGLGLASCVEIINRHGGGLSVVSQEGRGTTFEVFLPLAATAAAAAPRSPEYSGVPEWRTSGRVLIIDDEPMVARLTAMVLEHLGLKPTTEHTGVEAIARLRQSLTDGTSGYRVCVVDLTMPDLSGPDLLRQIKALAPDLPVLLTSGFSEQQLRVRGAFSGFDGFIQKPFRMSAMVDVLRKMLDE
jgi:two-component system cell cycle sensor histidine kinase/response regulator CckA